MDLILTGSTLLRVTEVGDQLLIVLDNRARANAQNIGGRDEDTANLVTLVQELKTAFGDDYGISATLPSSYCTCLCQCSENTVHY